MSHKTLKLTRNVEVTWDGVPHVFVAGEVTVPDVMAQRIVAQHADAVEVPELPAEVVEDVEPSAAVAEPEPEPETEPETPKKAKKAKKA